MNQNEWYTIEQAALAMGRARRATVSALADISPCLVRALPTENGRPRKLFHCSAHPKLRAHFMIENHSPEPAPGAEPVAGVHPQDLAVARLRARAVREYLERRAFTSEAIAAVQTCEDWAIKPRALKVALDERRGRDTRKHRDTVALGRFSIGTLRNWAALYDAGKGDLATLAPQRKCHSGAKQVQIPKELLTLVHAAAVSTARADITKAVALARREWPGDFPQVSIDTWRRRILARDPEKACSTLGKLGIQEFRHRHSPDAERDYSNLRYNQLWQLDDIEEDFYAHSAVVPANVIRPKLYAIIRISTRQWISAVACETPIVQDQTRSLIGLSMSNSQGGVPEEITFERGAVACDDYLHDLLCDLGVRVHRTGMDVGQVHPGALPDTPSGRPHAKAIVEANGRLHHNHLAFAPGQVGPAERFTAHANLDAVKKESTRRIEAGELPILWTSQQWQGAIFQALEAHNNASHSGLPRTVDPVTGAKRHLSPNEYAAMIGNQEVRVMPESYLPLFFQKGEQVTVTRNGILLKKTSYGRYDDELVALAGQKVIAYAMPEYPLAYVVELGRCVDEYVPPQYGDTEQIKDKRAVERAKRNQYEAMIAAAANSHDGAFVSMTRFTRNPVPERPARECTSAALAFRTTSMQRGVALHNDRMRKLDEKFTRCERETSPVPASRRGLLAKAQEYSAHISVLAGGADQQEISPFAE